MSCHVIKQALVRDLRLREKTIRQLEAKNATLAAKWNTPTPAPHGRIPTRRSSADTGKPAEENHRSAVLSARRVSSHGEVGAKEAQGSRESRAPGVDRPPAGVPHRENGECRAAATNPHATGFGQSGTTASASAASIARPARKKLTPQASEIPGRVATISYPRCGSRATFTPAQVAAPKTTPEMDNKASGSVTSPREADIKTEEETPASPVLSQLAGKVPLDDDDDDHDRRRRNETQDDITQIQQFDTCEAQAQPSPSPGQQASEKTKPSFDHSPSSSSQEARQPPCPFAEKALPNNHPRSSCTVKEPDAHVGLGTAMIGGAQDAQYIGGDGGGGRGGGGDGAMQTLGQESDDAECREGSNGLVDGGRATASPTRSSTTAGNNEPDCTKPLPSNGEVEEVEPGAKQGLEMDVESSVPPRLDDIGTESETPVFRSRLVDGVPVLKYGGGGKAKPKPKVLWVSPDLSEIFYTQTGR